MRRSVCQTIKPFINGLLFVFQATGEEARAAEEALARAKAAGGIGERTTGRHRKRNRADATTQAQDDVARMNAQQDWNRKQGTKKSSSEDTKSIDSNLEDSTSTSEGDAIPPGKIS